MGDGGSPDTKSLSRRDFLKLAGAGALGLAFRKPIESLQNAAERPGLETNTAKYYSFYELHNIGISLDELKQVNGLNVFFTELDMDAKTSNDINPGDLMHLSFRSAEPTMLFHLSKASETRRLFPDKYLDYFRLNDVCVAIEGSTLGSFDGTLDVLTRDAERVTSNVIILEESLRAFYKTFIKKETSMGTLIRTSTALGYWFWAMSPDIASQALTAFEEETPNTEQTEKDTLAIHRFAESLHPEHLVVALRNVFMARRLQTIGETLFNEKLEKPKIAFRAGKAHSGIERFLSIGHEQTIHTLDIYPDWVFKRMIEENDKSDNSFEDKIDTFCSFSLLSTRDDTKRRITDNRLKEYLTQRLSKT